MSRLLWAGAVLLLGCEVELSAKSVKIVPLPADIMTGPARAGVQTKEGHLFAAPVTGGLLRLSADGGAWEDATPVVVRFLPDFKEGLSIAQQGDGRLLRTSSAGFVDFEPAVPALSNPAFSNNTTSFVLGRDARGVLWASASPTFASNDGGVTLAHFEGSDWQYDEVPITFPRQTLALKPAMTSDARFFFRPDQSGLWEIDLPNHALVQRVTCEHELFRASSDAFMPCQEDTQVFAGRNGELFLLNPNRELWRIAASGTTPSLAVKSALPNLEGAVVGAPSTYVDPKGRVWLGFRWGRNVDADTSSLYVAEPSKKDAWVYLKSDLPRAIALFGDGDAPVISSTSQNIGLLLFRVTEAP